MKYTLHCTIGKFGFSIVTDWVPSVGDRVQYRLSVYVVTDVIRYLDSPEAVVSLKAEPE